MALQTLFGPLALHHQACRRLHVSQHSFYLLSNATSKSRKAIVPGGGKNLSVRSPFTAALHESLLHKRNEESTGFHTSLRAPLSTSAFRRTVSTSTRVLSAFKDMDQELAKVAGTEETVEGCTVRHQFLQNGSVRLHYVESGNPEDDLVVLLHGFPSFWYTWKHQFGPLSRAGYHVVAPDMRGYNLSDKPSGVAAYSRATLTSDLEAIVDQLGHGKPATVVGHDWGGMVAWAFAQDFSEKVARLVAINIPHPALFKKALSTNTAQMRRSWYMFMFQLPMLGEAWTSANGYSVLRSIVGGDVKPPESEDHMQRHVDAFSKPGALTGSINYYRGLRQWTPPKHSKKVIELPVAIIWGDEDKFFVPEISDPPPELVPNCSVLHVPEATHWVMWERPEVVSQRILQFMAGEVQPTTTTAPSTSRL
eukprot:TRINITY_DN3712_c0_g1_i1.p1 TRINITY_DN3712_c0_g1~~TRINITY_DN3712_c0_g1_i1.p1  ORF type:complete len:421 (+),score=40.95 TRINITY_DN3712_c0_g1_i1:102-1364(+)